MRGAGIGLPDDAVIDELANTTEVQLQSSVRYISATGQDHMRDGLLALTQGITKWEASNAKPRPHLLRNLAGFQVRLARSGRVRGNIRFILVEGRLP